MKFHSELTADSAVGAVTADQPGGLGNFVGAVGVTEGRYDFVVGCGAPRAPITRNGNLGHDKLHYRNFSVLS